MAGTIKGMTIEIGGNTAPLENALKDVNREINTTQKELKEVNRLLKLDPTNTELVKQKQQLLGDQIKSTTTKLDALKQAQKQLDEQMKKGGNVNQEEYRKLQREIITTENSLKNLKKQAEECDPKMQKLNEAMKKAGEVAQKGLKVGCDLVVAGLKGMAIATATAITSLVTLGVKAGQTADELNTMSKITGVSTKELQEFQYASKLIDVDMSTMAKTLQKTTSSMSSASKGTGKQAEAFKKLGVQIKNADGSLRDNNDVFKESIRALGDIANETERDAIAMDLFGKSASELNPLIEGGIDALEEYSKQANELGLILSQDTLDGANKFNDQLDILKANGQGIFTKIGAEVAKELTPAMESLNDATKKVIKRMSTALDNGGLQGLFEEFINMVNEVDLTEIANMINQGLETIFETWNTFFDGIDWQELGSKIIEFIKTIDWQNLIAGVFSLIGNIIGAGLGFLSGAFTTLKEDISNWWQEKLDEAGGDSGKAFLNGAKETIISSGSTLYDSLAQPLAQGIADALNIDVDIPNFHKLVQNIQIWWEETKLWWDLHVIQPIAQFWADIIFKFVCWCTDIYLQFQKFKDGLVEKWNNFWTWLGGIPQSIVDWCVGIFNNIVQFFTDLIAKVHDFFTITVPEKWNSFYKWLKELPQKMADIGKNLVEGLWNGIVNMKDWLWKKLKEWCGSILDGVKAWFGIESPSKVMADEVGAYMAQGIGVGFDKTMPSVIKAMEEKLAEVTDAFKTELTFGDIPQIEGNKIISENQYITKNYSNTIETIRQPQTVELLIDGTKIARTLIQPLDNEFNRLGVKI